MFTIYVDWGHNARFTHPLADISSDVLAAEWSLGHPTPADGIPPDARLIVTLDNADRRYSPHNPASPLAGLIVPGRRVRVQLDGHSLWLGWLTKITISAGRYGPRTAILIAEGGLGRLRQEPIRFTPQSGIRTDAVAATAFTDAIIAASVGPALQLDASQFATLDDSSVIFDPATQFSSSPAQTTLNYVGDQWTGRATAATMIAQVTAAEAGRFWQGRDGRFIFQDRHAALLGSPPESVDLDWSANAATADRAPDPISTVQVTCYPRTVSTEPQVVWQTPSPLRIPANTEQHLQVSVEQFGQGVLSLAPLVADVDFSAVDDFGRSASQFVTVVATLIGGGLADVRIRNGASGAVRVTVTVRGTTITDSGAITVEANDLLRVVEYGRRVDAYQLQLIDDIETARAFAAWKLWQWRDGYPALTHITVRDRDVTWRANMLRWTLGVQLHLSEYQVGAGHRYDIIGEAWTYIPADGLAVSYTLAPTDPNTYFITDIAPLDAVAVGY